MSKIKREKYDYRDLKKEREFGFYWYSLIWRILRPILIFAASLVFSFGIIGMVYNYIYKNYISPINIKDKTEISFVINNGSSLSKVSKDLEKIGLIKNSHVFKYYCDFIGLGQKIQSGDYLLSKSMNISEIANTLTTGDGNPITAKITIIPGQSIDEIANRLYSDKIIDSEKEFLDLCVDAKEFQNYYFIDDLYKSSLVKNRKYVLEGYLAADTYEIYTKTTAKQIIAKLLSQTDKVFISTYHDRADELGMTMDQVLTLASMIEKEAKTNDFTKVSAIFHNRINKGMKLQSDVTVHYVTNIKRMLLNKDDINVNSPYNTYVINGLPLGPICSPSPKAIYAALYPDTQFIAEDYLYFCSKDPNTGELYFSKTLQEHEQAVAIYAPLWKSFDESRGLSLGQ